MKLRRILLTLLVISPVLLFNCRDEVRSQPYFDRLVTLIVAGEAPDVGYVDSLRATEYINQDLLWPIPDELVEDDFYPQLLAYFQREGQTYALPRDFQTVALLVNMDLFEEAGLLSPSELEEFKWDHFQEIAAVLTNPDEDVYGVGLTAGLVNWLPFLLQAGGSPLDESGAQITLDTEEAWVALTFYTDLIRNGYALVSDGPWPFLGMYGEGGLLEMFAHGKVAMILAGPTMYNDLKRLLEEMDSPPHVEVVELPEGPAGKATIAYVVGFGLFREPSASALAFLQFVTSGEGMQIWFSPESLDLKPPIPAPPIYMPARISQRDAWMEAHPDTAAFMSGVDYLSFYQPPTASFQGMEEFDRLAAEILSAVLRAEITVEEAVQELQANGDAILAEFGQAE